MGGKAGQASDTEAGPSPAEERTADPRADSEADADPVTQTQDGEGGRAAEHAVGIDNLPKVSEQLNTELDQPLDEQEHHAALQSMEGGTAPGTDGLPVEFYKALWAELGAGCSE
ncbi:hypothetical protein MHYP_G00100950 [Metynnis hypsauchen]